MFEKHLSTKSCGETSKLIITTNSQKTKQEMLPLQTLRTISQGL